MPLLRRTEHQRRGADSFGLIRNVSSSGNYSGNQNYTTTGGSKNQTYTNESTKEIQSLQLKFGQNYQLNRSSALSYALTYSDRAGVNYETAPRKTYSPSIMQSIGYSLEISEKWDLQLGALHSQAINSSSTDSKTEANIFSIGLNRKIRKFEFLTGLTYLVASNPNSDATYSFQSMQLSTGTKFTF